MSKKKVSIEKEQLEKLLYLFDNKKSENGILITENNVPSTIPKDSFFQMIYDDITNLKRDTSGLIQESIAHGKSLKEIREDVKNIMNLLESIKKLEPRVSSLETSVEKINEDMPTTIKKWIENRTKVFGGLLSIGKIIFWIIVLSYVTMNALPSIFNFLVDIARYKTGVN